MYISIHVHVVIFYFFLSYNCLVEGKALQGLCFIIIFDKNKYSVSMSMSLVNFPDMSADLFFFCSVPLPSLTQLMLKYFDGTWQSAREVW